MTLDKILSLLPYSEPFRFVDELIHVDEKGSYGTYTFREDAFFYKGHFKNNPVTPGVLLIETMAQIGVVPLGIFLKQEQLKTENPDFTIAMTSSEAEYYLPVFPNEKVTVRSEKIYFRFGKLKCKVEMRNKKNELVCKGVIAGMIKSA